MNQVTMYTSNHCAYCRMAKRLLEQRGIAAQELNIDVSTSSREEMIRRTGRRTVPQIFIGEHHVGGFDDLALLDRSGQLAALF